MEEGRKEPEKQSGSGILVGDLDTVLRTSVDPSKPPQALLGKDVKGYFSVTSVFI